MLPAWFHPRISDFLTWWGEELRGLLPGAPSSSRAQQARTVLGVEPAGLRLIETTGPKSDPRPAGLVPVPAMLAYLASRVAANRGPGDIGLRLPYAGCFVRRLELPAAARRDFGPLLAMDLERSTPFKTKDVLTAYEVTDAPALKGLLKVRHLIVKRQAIDDLKAQIEALGLKLSRVDCTQEDGTAFLPVNFLAPSADALPTVRKGGIAAAVLSLTACALAASAVYFYVDRHEQALQGLQAQTAKLKVKAQAQKDALAKTQAAFVEIANYWKLRSEMVSRVAILEELTRILPDTAWVTDAKFDGGTVDISGLAVSAAALVPILERSKVFVDATSTASLTFDPREERERFAIRARIRSANATTPEAKSLEPAP